MRRNRVLGIVLGMVLLSACGGGGASTPSPSPNPAPPAAPSVTSLSPSSAVAGGTGFQLTVNGSGFDSATTVRWNGSNRSTTFVSATEVRAAIQSADIAVAGSAAVGVVKGGVTSNTLSFQITTQSTSAQIVLISVAVDGSPANGDSFSRPAISPDGRFVAFQSNGTNLVPGPASGFSDIYLRDTCQGVASGCAPVTLRVSVASDGSLANGNSRTPALSANGRFVVFDSSATNLVPNDNNGTSGGASGNADVFLRDTCLGAAAGCVPTTVRVSLANDGSESNGDSRDGTMSEDSRYILFSSAATNLVTGDTNAAADVFLRDTCLGAGAGCSPSTELVSVTHSGGAGNSPSGRASASSDARFFAFRSFATNLVANDTNNQVDDFIRDTCRGASGCSPSTLRVSVASDGTQANDRDDLDPKISAQGRHVAFTSHATNLVQNDTNGRADVFVRDTCAGATGCTPATTRVSVGADGSQADWGSEMPSISGTGRFVVFSSLATNLIPGGTISPKTIFLRDTCVGAPSGCTPTTILIGRSATGAQDNGVSEYPAISADGRWVAFVSTSTNLAPGGSNGRIQTLLAKTGF